MAYPIEFFEIQEYFALRVSKILKVPFDEALLRYTSFYKRIGVGNWDFNISNPLWLSFIERISGGQPPAEAAFDLYKATQPRIIDNATRFGCMGFDCRGVTIVMHFRNDFNSAQGPLSKRHRIDRLTELKEMFSYISRYYCYAQFVEGCSWLYNYEAYCRLFPQEYIAAMELVQETPVRLHSAWGQFINSSGEINSERTAIFKQKVEAATSIVELLDSFPFSIYKSRVEIKFFYFFYGVQRP
ncbi:MAG TPA: hypothetical protein VNV85_03315 [Puia sp.]|nr:hypothetical protein [Puia sp.]